MFLFCLAIHGSNFHSQVIVAFKLFLADITDMRYFQLMGEQVLVESVRGPEYFSALRTLVCLEIANLH